MPDSINPFREVKRTLSGQERVYDCEALHSSPRLAIVRFEFTKTLVAGETTFPVQAYTLGFFWRGRHYNLYHSVTAGGELIADRFDIVDHVRIQTGGVRYEDLLLDIWLYPDGRTAVEDEDEVEAAVAAGQLSPARRKIITRTRALLLRRSPSIVRRALEEFHLLAGSQEVVG